MSDPVTLMKRLCEGLEGLQTDLMETLGDIIDINKMHAQILKMHEETLKLLTDITETLGQIIKITVSPEKSDPQGLH